VLPVELTVEPWLMRASTVLVIEFSETEPPRAKLPPVAPPPRATTMNLASESALMSTPPPLAVTVEACT